MPPLVTNCDELDITSQSGRRRWHHGNFCVAHLAASITTLQVAKTTKLTLLIAVTPLGAHHFKLRHTMNDRVKEFSVASYAD
jgi:hypothetical protein